jgi:exopolyphosphatase/guanosine-5'-triphosphate,3'-diphosphate pyrophosphatase
MKAVIDIGTNSVLLLVGHRDAQGQVHVTHDDARITRLGRGVAATGVLDPIAIERTLEVLADYRRSAESFGAELVPVATEGLRMASDPAAFLKKAESVLGCQVRMISGGEEAELSYLSVAREQPPGPLRVLDIGGGSTELVVGYGEHIEHMCSHAIGSVRLTERFVQSDPPSPAAIEGMQAAAREAFALQSVTPYPELYGLAGTVITLAAILLDLPCYQRECADGQRFSREAVVALRDRLAAETLEQRLKRPCLPAGRADVIVAGLTILVAAMEHCGADELIAFDRGLRYALI